MRNSFLYVSTLLVTVFISVSVSANVNVDSLISKADLLIETGKRYLGKPYRYRADSGFNFDCSGFVSHVLLKHDIRVPRSSRDMVHAVRKVPLGEIRKGDLLFFKGRNASSSVIGHVAMVVDPTPGAIKMIHASSRGIVIDSYPTPFYARRYVTAGRIAELDVEDANPVESVGTDVLSAEPVVESVIQLADLPFASVDSLFDQIEQFDRGFGAVSVFNHGEEVYSRFYGFSSVEKHTPNDSSTLFRIGSVSKTFTAVIIFKLIEEGKIKLDDPLRKWFPQFGNARKITVRHLLGHQSGLYNFTNDAKHDEWRVNPFSKKELLTKLLHYPNVFMPGTRTEYSNTNYVLLSWIAEEASGQSYAELLKRIVVVPANLTSTFSATEKSLNMAHSYKRMRDWQLVPPTHESIPLGAGALVSTPAELNRFMQALFTGKLISGQSLAEMTSGGERIGLGLIKVPFHEREAWGHTGGIDGFQTRTFYFPADSVSVSVTSNGVVFPQNDMMIAVLSEVFDKPYTLPVFKKIIDVDPEQLVRYTGVYSATGLPIQLTITVKDGVLIGQGTGQPPFPLVCTGPNQFEFEAGGILLIFTPQQKQMVLQQMGNRFVMKKE